ncbi:MAG: hypothetical protein ACJAW3_000469 [Lentimonas sp.]|jgi:hypothetical protein
MTTKFVNNKEVVDGFLRPTLKEGEDWDEISSLFITSNRNLIQLTKADLPKFLLSLSLSGCSNLQSVEPPETATKLILNECSNLQNLSILSLKELELLNLEGCNNIKWTAEIELHLQFLEEKDCKITYPENHSKYTQKIVDEANIRKAQTQLSSLNNSHNPNLHKLLNIYLTKHSEQQKSTAIKEVARLLNIIDEKPEDKIWLEEIAPKFTNDETDLNKNALGLFYISSWLKVARQENEEAKLEALIPLMIYDFISQFVKKECEEKENYSSFEIQLLTNAALQKIHQELKGDGDFLNWTAVPKSIFPRQIKTSEIHGKSEMARQSSEILKKPIQEKVNEFLTKKNIEHLMKGTTQILTEMTEENVDSFFLNKSDLIELWCKTTFPKEYQIFKPETPQKPKLKASTSNEDGWFRNVQIFENRIIDLTKKLIPKTKTFPQASQPLSDRSSKKIVMS